MKKVGVVFIGLILLFSIGCLEKKENTPPQVSMKIDGTLGTEGWYTSSVTITVTASDNKSSVEELRYRIDGDMWRDYLSRPFTIKTDGIHIVELYAKDGNGNDISYNFSVKIDATQPFVNFTDFEAGYVYWRGKKAPPLRIPRDTMIIGNYMFTADASDFTSGIKKVEFYLNDNIALEDLEAPYEWELNHAFGIYNVTVLTYDHAGNYNQVVVPEVQIFNL